MRSRVLMALLSLLAASVVLSGAVQAQSVPEAAPNPDVVACSPAPCVLPPTWPSTSSFIVDAPIAADPLNPQRIILGANNDNCVPVFGVFLGVYISNDGGSNWQLFCMRPFIRRGGQGFDPADNPMVGFDRKGTSYAAGLYLDDGFPETGFIAFEKSVDGGVTWSDPEPAMGHGDANPPDTWLTVDTNASSPYVNSIYISGVFIGQTSSGEQVVVSHSNDGGTTWHQAAVAPARFDPAVSNYTNVTTGRDGSVYVTWMYCNKGPNACSDSKGHMLFSKSTDGGNTWTKPRLITTVNLIFQLPNAQHVRVFNFPVIGVDNSDGPHAGNLYVVMYNWTGSYMRVQVCRSTDGGNTWSKPVPVAPGYTHDQFFPWLSVSKTGLVGVSWLDRRNDPATVDYQAFAAISQDGGRSFQPNVQLTTAFSDPNVGTASGWMGDYTGNTWAGSNFLAAWMDNSNSTYMVDAVGGIRLK